MKVILTKTWKATIDVLAPGAGADEVIKGKIVAEFNNLSLTQIRQMELDNRKDSAKLSQLRRESVRGFSKSTDGWPLRSPDLIQSEIIELEGFIQNADKRWLDRIVCNVHQLEVDKADGEPMNKAELLEYVKTTRGMAEPLVERFAQGVKEAEEKNSSASAAP